MMMALRILKLILVIAPFTAGQAAALEKADRVIVEKAARLITLMQGQKQLVQYKIALGRSPVGPKRCQGDKKTPEGEYTITGRNPGSAFHKSLRISYPSARDRTASAALRCPPGGDIMIHGLPNGQGSLGAAHRNADWTDGCIAVTDEEIEDIWKRVPDGAKVTIKP